MSRSLDRPGVSARPAGFRRCKMADSAVVVPVRAFAAVAATLVV
jgi:hypothetical protein